ncbi:MAG: hypothetical protein PHX78_01880, partial [bacterium]|nr:hypothetical protein [bacterium]
MKKTLLILAVCGFIIAVSSSAFAYSFTFTGGSGDALAEMDLTISGNTLNIMLDNTSPKYSVLDSTHLNIAAITEFGFDFDSTSGPIQTPSPWQMSAYRYINGALSDSAIVIGGNPNANLNKWTISYDRNFPGAGMKLDYVPENGIGNKNALYNPLLAGQS